MTEVSVRELRDRLTYYLRRLEQGEQLTVTRRGKPVAVVTPVATKNDARAKLLAAASRGVIRWSGEKPRLPRRRIKLKGSGPSISEMVLEDRR